MPARSLYNTSSAQPATLSLNVQSFQSTTFNGGRRIYDYHPLTSCMSLAPHRSFVLPALIRPPPFSSSYASALKLTLRKASESWSENWLRATIKTILWKRNGPRNFICPGSMMCAIIVTFGGQVSFEILECNTFVTAWLLKSTRNFSW